MTTTIQTTDLPAIPAQEITAAREQGISSVQASLNSVWALVQTLPEVQRVQAETAIMATWETAQIMGNQWAETQELLMRSVALVQGQQMALTEVSNQRDRAIKEMTELLQAIKRRDINHPIISAFYSELYDEVRDEHNAAFWESLPYDMADTLGGKWDFMDAQTLYDLISNTDSDLEDDDFAEEYGWTGEGVKVFREKLLALIRDFKHSQEG